MAGSSSHLCTSADLALVGLEAEIRKVIGSESEGDGGLSSKVARLLVHQFLNTGNLSEVGFRPGDVLTVFQFQLFLKHEHSLHKLIQDLTQEGSNIHTQ